MHAILGVLQVLYMQIVVFSVNGIHILYNRVHIIYLLNVINWTWCCLPVTCITVIVNG